MANLGRIVAGFIGGAANTGLDLLKEKREDEREIKKAKLLAELRLSTDKEIADYTDKLSDSDVDKDMTTTENGQMIIRDKQGREVSRRALTKIEQEAQDFTSKSNKLKLEDAVLGLDKTRAEIGLAGAQSQYYRNGGSGGGSGSGLSGLDEADVSGMIQSEIEYKAKDDIAAARKAGISGSDISMVVDRIIQREKVRGKPDLNSAARQVRDALSILARGTDKDSGELDRDSFKEANSTYRKQRGLDSR